MGWVSPTGFVDVSSKWSDEPNAYDENIGTWAETSTALKSLHLNCAALSCNKIRIFAADYKAGSFDPDFHISVFHDPDTTLIWNGTIIKDSWVEIPIGSTEQVSKLLIYANSLAGGHRIRLYEADFWEVEVTPGWNKILYTSEPPTPNAWNQVKREAGTGWRKLLYT